MNKPEFTSNLEKKSEWSRSLTVTIPQKELDAHFEDRVIDAQKVADLKGFRKGHAPISIVKQTFGAKIRKEVVSDLVDACYRHALMDHQLNPVGTPKLEFQPSETGVTFLVLFDIFPEIKVKKYQGFSLVREIPSVSDSDVEALVDRFREQHAELVPVEGRAVQADDFVDFNYEGEVLESPGKREDLKGSRVFQMGKGELIPGFEEALLGMSPGESKSFETKYPAGFQELSGKPVKFTVLVNGIKLKRLPEWTDDFAKQVGFETVLDLKVKARQGIEAERQSEANRKLENDLISQLIDKNPFELPESLIEDEKKLLQAEWVRMLQEQQASPELIEGAIKKEEAALKARAEKQVRASLILNAIAEAENIQAAEADLDAEYQRQAQSMGIALDEVRKHYKGNERSRTNLLYRIRERKTLEYLVQQSKVTEKTAS